MNQVDEIGERLLQVHGPLIGGSDLIRALGFKTAAALKKAQRAGHLRLNLFTIEGRRGLFSLTTDVAAWLVSVSTTHAEQHSTRRPEQRSQIMG